MDFRFSIYSTNDTEWISGSGRCKSVSMHSGITHNDSFCKQRDSCTVMLFSRSSPCSYSVPQLIRPGIYWTNCLLCNGWQLTSTSTCLLTTILFVYVWYGFCFSASSRVNCIRIMLKECSCFCSVYYMITSIKWSYPYVYIVAQTSLLNTPGAKNVY